MHWYGKTGYSRLAPMELHLEKHARRVEVYSPSAMRSVFEKLEYWMRVLGYPRKDIFAVTLALHEAATNGFRHGNRGDTTKYLHVTYVVTEAEVLVEVQDQGRGFEPDQVSDPLVEEYVDRPGGRGLFLMRAYMSWVVFNEQGTA
jgi:serine/threonine-protein kinase RsbW